MHIPTYYIISVAVVLTASFIFSSVVLYRSEKRAQVAEEACNSLEALNNLTSNNATRNYIQAETCKLTLEAIRELDPRIEEAAISDEPKEEFWKIVADIYITEKDNIYRQAVKRVEDHMSAAVSKDVEDRMSNIVGEDISGEEV